MRCALQSAGWQITHASVILVVMVQTYLLLRRLGATRFGSLVAPHMQAAYASLGFAPDDLPIAREIHEQVLSLPLGPYLANDEQHLVIEALRESLLTLERKER